VSVRHDGGGLRAAAVVGADGVNGVCRRALGDGPGPALAVALEANLPWERLPHAGRYRGRAVLEVGVVPGGYGWVFPKGDHVNLGVGGWLAEGPRLRAHLDLLCRRHGVRPSHLFETRGHRLPVRRAASPTTRRRPRARGDAAGLVDPLSGDGLYEAFLSAELAASAVLDLLAGRRDALDGYAEDLTGALAGHVAASWSAKLAMDRMPRLAVGVAGLPGASGVFRRRLRAEGGPPRPPRRRPALARGIAAAARAGCGRGAG
jgi:flavin-dependent dehydrogenase